MASALSFQGLSTGLQTDALVSAILAQEGKGVETLTARQTRNKARSTALTSMKTSMNTLMVSLAALQDKFNSRTVTSTDANNTNVTATGTGASAGSYDLSVATIATKGRVASSITYSGSSSNDAAASFVGSTAKTATGVIGFNITSSMPDGTVAGTFTVNGTAYDLTGSGGTLTGAAGTPLEGLSVAVNGTGTGALTLTATPANMATATATEPIFTGASGSFAVRGTDGVVKTITVDNNSLNGLRDAINASGAGVTASIVNTGSGAKPYQLVVTAKETGTGNGSLVSIAALTGAAQTNTLGILAGSVDSADPLNPTLSGGLTSDLAGTSAKDAVFTLNGIQLTRKTNVVTDAAEGMTFTLKQGGQTGTTTLTVAQDKTAATAGMQDVITKFNALQKIYKDASTATKDSNGTILPGALTGDASSRAILAQIRSALTGTSAGLPSSSAFQNPASLGVKTLADGTLGLDTAMFQAAVEKDPVAAKRLFAFSGDSSNGVVAVQSGGAKTATGTVGFTINSYSAGGAVSGTFTGTSEGSPFSITLNGSNGVLVGGMGTALEGLTLSVTATGSGTLTLSRGAGQATRDLITNLTASGTGSIAMSLAAIETQNRTLATQIDAGTSALERRKKLLQAQFSKMEVAVAQMKAAAGQVTGL